ncbi:MAG: DUF2752 domain-containing protein [Clostridiales bacterium]|nr:DUF2752 domain-containing protein [Clostridiales bacterium]
MKKNIEPIVFLLGSVIILLLSLILTFQNETVTFHIGKLYFASGYQCPIYSVFHIPCPTCGLTRAFVLFAHLDFKRAYMYNPSVFILFPYILLQIPLQIIDLIKRKKHVNNNKMRKTNLYILIAVGFILIIIWVAKLAHILPIL